MGMAASQARLLSITARIHDVEYQAQSIENAKVQLATQQDAVYREYINALDEQALVIKTPTTKVPATFNNLCSHNRLSDLGRTYAIKDKYGRLIVEDDIAEGYKSFNAAGFADLSMGIRAPQAFALYMLDKDNGIKTTDNLRGAEEEAYNTLTNNGTNVANPKLKELRDELINKYCENDDIYDIADSIGSLESTDKEEYNRKLSEYNKALSNYLNALYSSNYTNKDGTTVTGAQLVYENAEKYASADCPTAQDLDMGMFNYYVSIYNQIVESGACISINEFNGTMGGDAASDSDFLQLMISSGEFTIELVTKQKDGTVEMTGTSPSSDEFLSYVNATDVDNTRAKKLEAQYEHDLKEINHKDKQLDMSLSKLETQRKALTTEYDSVKKVIDDNIERTFGIFS